MPELPSPFGLSKSSFTLYLRPKGEGRVRVASQRLKSKIVPIMNNSSHSNDSEISNPMGSPF